MTNEADSMRLMTRTRAALRIRHYSLRTEQAYVEWIRRYLVFHAGRRPEELGARDIAVFLTHLAMAHRVNAAGCHQARSALLFLYRSVLEVELPKLVHVHMPVPSAAVHQMALDLRK